MAGLSSCWVVVEDYEERDGGVGVGEFCFDQGAEVTWVDWRQGGEGFFQGDWLGVCRHFGLRDEVCAN